MRTLVGVLIGYGLYWAVNTNNGRRAMSSMELSLGKNIKKKRKEPTNDIGSSDEGEASE